MGASSSAFRCKILNSISFKSFSKYNSASASVPVGLSPSSNTRRFTEFQKPNHRFPNFYPRIQSVNAHLGQRQASSGMGQQQPVLPTSWNKALLSIHGKFEAHVTLGGNAGERLSELKALGQKHGFHLTMIELSSGQNMSQLMTTTQLTGIFNVVATKTQTEIMNPLSQADFLINRVKIESLQSNAGVPETSLERKDHPPGNYFEYHWKLEVVDSADEHPRNLSALRQWALGTGVHVSRNTFGKNPTKPGTSYHFVTFRNYDGGRMEARLDYQNITKALKNNGWTIVKAEKEYVCHDSNFALDAGWK